MSLTRTIAHNTAIQIVGRIFSTALGLVVIGMLTRYLGEAGYGRYTTIMVYLQLFGVLVDLGLYIMLVKKISEPGADEQRVASNIFTMRLVSAVIVLGAAPLLSFLFRYPAEVRLGIAIATISFFGVTITQALTGIFQKYLHMEKIVIADLCGRVALIAATWWVIASHLGLPWIMTAVVIGSIVNTVVVFMFSRAFIAIRLAWDFAFWASIIRETWPIALSIVFNLVYFKADTLILSLVRSEAEVGVYGSSYKVLEVITTFPAMFAGLVLPLLASAWSMRDPERFRRVLQKAFDFLLMLAIPLVGGTLIIANPVMHVVTGKGFADAGSILQILIIATSTIFIGNLFGNAVVAVNRQRTMMWLYLAVAVVSLAGYLILIPRFSYFGAAWMTVLSELLVTSSAALIVLKATRVKVSLVFAGKALTAGLVMTGTLFLLRTVAFPLLIVIGACEYGMVLYLMKGISKDMILEIVQLRKT